MLRNPISELLENVFISSIFSVWLESWLGFLVRPWIKDSWFCFIQAVSIEVLWIFALILAHPVRIRKRAYSLYTDIFLMVCYFYISLINPLLHLLCLTKLEGRSSNAVLMLLIGSMVNLSLLTILRKKCSKSWVWITSLLLGLILGLLSIGLSPPWTRFVLQGSPVPFIRLLLMPTTILWFHYYARKSISDAILDSIINRVNLIIVALNMIITFVQADNTRSKASQLFFLYFGGFIYIGIIFLFIIPILTVFEVKGVIVRDTLCMVLLAGSLDYFYRILLAYTNEVSIGNLNFIPMITVLIYFSFDSFRHESVEGDDAF